MSTHIKPINKQNTKIAVNGKLCVLQYGPNKMIESIKYSSELTSIEEKDFKEYLESIEKLY